MVNLVTIDVLLDALPSDTPDDFIQRLLDLPSPNGVGTTLAWSKAYVHVVNAIPLANTLPNINWDEGRARVPPAEGAR